MQNRSNGADIPPSGDVKVILALSPTIPPLVTAETSTVTAVMGGTTTLSVTDISLLTPLAISAPLDVRVML